MAKAQAGKLRIGEEVVSRGYCSAQDVERALKIQREEDQRGDRHRLLGIILLQEGRISTEQLLELLRGLAPPSA